MTFIHDSHFFKKFEAKEFGSVDVLAIAKSPGLSVDVLADAIIEASENGSKPVKVNYGDNDNWLRTWGRYGFGSQVDHRLMSKGHDITASSCEYGTQKYHLTKSAKQLVPSP